MAEEEKPLKHILYSRTNVDESYTAEAVGLALDNELAAKRADLEKAVRDYEAGKAENDAKISELQNQIDEINKDPRAYHRRMVQKFRKDVNDVEKRFAEEEETLKETEAYQQAKAEFDAAVQNLDPNLPDYEQRTKELERKFRAAASPQYKMDMLRLSKEGQKLKGDFASYIEEAVRDLKVKINQTELETSAEGRKVQQLKNQENAIKTQKNIYNKDPELYASLYAVKDSTSQIPESGKKVELGEHNGKPCLAVLLQHENVPYGFVISDGKIHFNQETIDKMSLEAMRSIINYLDRHGISGLSLPEGIDDKLAAYYQQAKDEENKELLHDQTEIAAATQEQVNDDRADVATEAPAPQNYDYKNTVAQINDWVYGENGMNKREGYTAFKEYKIKGGYDVWVIYDQGNFDNRELDGKIDKEGNVKVKYALKIYSRMGKDKDGNPRLEINYAMPGNKKISGAYAGGIARMAKKSGCTHMSFPSGMNENDEEEFRFACAKNGLVPRLGNLTEAKVKEMLSKAEPKLSSKEFLEYKLAMAEWMEKCAIKDQKGKPFAEHKNAKYINNLKAEYKYTPFRDMYEGSGGLRELFESKISDAKADKEKGAVEVAGAARALAKFYKLYGSYESGKVSDMLNQFSAAEREAILNAGVNPDTLVRNLKPAEAQTIYKGMIQGEVKKATQELLTSYDNNKKLDKEERSELRDLVHEVVESAEQEIAEVNNSLKDYGVKDIYLPKNYGYPKFDFSKHDSSFHRDRNNDNRNGR